jgi:hypothetical protein
LDSKGYSYGAIEVQDIFVLKNDLIQLAISPSLIHQIIGSSVGRLKINSSTHEEGIKEYRCKNLFE